MAKTDFTKVEEVLAEGMRQIEVNRLLSEADENAAKNKAKVASPTANQEASKVNAIQLQRLSTIRQDLKAFEKQGIDPYAKLQIDKEEIKKFIKNPESLASSDWDKIKIIKEKISVFKKELELNKEPLQSGFDDKKEASDVPVTIDDELINKERKTQKNKRFNINNKWLPLR